MMQVSANLMVILVVTAAAVENTFYKVVRKKNSPNREEGDLCAG